MMRNDRIRSVGVVAIHVGLSMLAYMLGAAIVSPGAGAGPQEFVFDPLAPWVAVAIACINVASIGLYAASGAFDRAPIIPEAVVKR